MKGLKDLGNLMKQAQQVQESMKKAQEEIAGMEIEGQAGGGLVKTLINGKHMVKSLDIDPSLLSDDKDMLEDLVAAAFNDAVAKLEVAIKARFSEMTGGLDLPAGIQMPF
jgi:nucleoid-associated protein EbfC